MRPTEEIARLKERIAELEAWKESALAVEREWDVQAVAQVLKVPLGAATRPAIAKRVPILVEALERIARCYEPGPSRIAKDALRKAGIRK